MNYVKILGASGSKTKNTSTTCFQVFRDIVIDAGNIINSLGDEALYINHVFLTHSHSDHIIDLPFLIEGFFEQRKEPLKIYASKETISSLKAHTFNDEIWPDFSKINLLNSDKKSLEFIVIEANQTILIGQYSIKPIIANHIPGAFGYSVIKGNNGYLVSGDTYGNEHLTNEMENDTRLTTLLIECSFPNNMGELARVSKHLTPKLLKNELSKIKRTNFQVFIYHLKPSNYAQMVSEIKEEEILKNGGKVLQEGDVIHIDTGEIEIDKISHNKFERIMNVNMELSSELDKTKLFDMILNLTKDLTHCEAGTLYIKSKDEKSLEFKVVQNIPLNIDLGGTKGEIDWPSIDLYLEDGSENKNMVAAVSAIENKIINIPDVYEEKSYNFEGTKKFDKSTGYRSKSMLVVPLINHEKEVIGVLQLINKTKVLGEIIAFEEADETIIKALASQAAMALTNSQLITSLEEFLNSFVSTIAKAIDAKSKHTMHHIRRVKKVSKLIAEDIHNDKTIYKDVKYSKNDFKQIELASLMHDIGKISMPEAIIDKSTKLETIVDRVIMIQDRFEILKRDVKIDYLEKKISKDEYEQTLKNIQVDLEFINEINKGAEFVDDSKIDKIEELSKKTYIKNGIETKLLTDDEKKNLSIRKGTLTDEEKRVMNNHAKLSLDMLTTLPFPKKYGNVFHIAANHHEKLNGKGYPRGLKDEDLVLEDRIMILADIFEALTSHDRPYKDGKKLSEVFKILGFMAKGYEIDSALLKFFFESEALQTYIKEELKDYQVDEVKLEL